MKPRCGKMGLEEAVSVLRVRSSESGKLMKTANATDKDPSKRSLK